MTSSNDAFRVALIQKKVSPRKEENLEYMHKSVAHAADKGARLIVFPEYFTAYATPGTEDEVSPKQTYEISESSNGAFAAETARLAKSYKINIATTFYERGKRPGEVYDSAIVSTPEGEKNFIYRKIHLFDALGAQESKRFAAGDKVSEIIDIDNNNGAEIKFSLGVEICYDIRFPELTRSLALEGANVIAVPSAWARGAMKEEHWFIMLRARAIENGVYVLAPDQIDNGCIGRTTCIDPFGVVMTDMGEREGASFVELSLDRIREVREKLPLLRHRKEKLYALTATI